MRTPNTNAIANARADANQHQRRADLSQGVYPEQDAQGACNRPRPREAFLGPRHAEVNRVGDCEVV